MLSCLYVEINPNTNMQIKKLRVFSSEQWFCINQATFCLHRCPRVEQRKDDPLGSVHRPQRIRE